MIFKRVWILLVSLVLTFLVMILIGLLRIARPRSVAAPATSLPKQTKTINNNPTHEASAWEQTTPEITPVPTDDTTNKLDRAVSETTTTQKDDQCSLDQWAIDFRISGGFAGIRQKMTFNHDGEITAINERSGEKMQVQAYQNDMEEIERALTAICISEPEKVQARPSKACADCFQYSLNIESKRFRHTLETDDVSMQESGFLPLISILRNINMEIWSGEYPS